MTWLGLSMAEYMCKPFKTNEIRDILESPGTAVINRSAITRLKSILGPKSSNLLPKLMDYFILDAKRLQTTAEQAINDSNPENLHKAAHTLKSTSASLGASALSEFCRDLEMLAKSGDLRGAGQILSSIKTEFDRVITDLLKIKDGDETK